MTIHLHGKTILVTREEKAGKLFANKINKYGGIALQAPLLQITCLPFGQHIIESINQKKYKWIFFTSKNGVDCFLKQNPSLDNCKIAAVGPKTAEAIEAYGYDVDFIPSVYNAKTMAKEFFLIEENNNPVLFVRGKISTSVLIDAFTELGRSFDCVEVYDTVINRKEKATLQKNLKKHTIDFITFTSPSTVWAFVELAESNEAYFNIPAVCIGTTTEKSAREAGFKQTMIPNEFTIEGMLESMSREVTGERG